MLAHFGITLPSSLSGFSKSLTGKAAIAPLGTPGNTNGEEGANTPPALDEDVLLSYYARLADHRPSSRLLKERMFEHGNKGPRSATLLVSGSPTFERPWRVAGHLARRSNTPAEMDNKASTRGQSFGVATRPKPAAALQGGRLLQVWGKQQTRSISSEALHDKSYSTPQQKQQQQEPQVHAPRLPSAESIASKKRGVLITTTRNETDEAQSLPKLHWESIVATTVEKSSARSVGSPRGSNAAVDTRSAPPVPNVSQRPSTAPAAAIVPSDGPDMTVGRGTQGSTNESTSCEELAKSSRHYDAGRSDNGTDNQGSKISAGSTQRRVGSGGGSSTHPPFDRREEPPPHGNSELTATPRDAAELTTENAFETEHDLLSYVSLRPATAEAARRPTIEADAALSRSPRLLASPSSIWPRSEGVFTGLSGTKIGNWGGSQENGEERGNHAYVAEDYLGTRTTEPSAEIRFAGDISLVTWNGLSVNGGVGKGRSAGVDSDGNTGKKTMNRGRLRLGGGGPGLQHQQRHQGKISSTPESGSIYNTSGTTERDLSSSSVSSSAAQARSTGTAWIEWSRPGECGELDLQANRVHAISERGGRYAAGRARNGAATGAGWGGYEEMMRVAAAPKAIRRQKEQRGSRGDRVEEQRPDTRERFYDAPVEYLKAVHPCVRCFDALMRHFRAGANAQANLGTSSPWTSSAAARDPHVAFFVRWESLDKELGRYVPRGFIGSFTPRPFRTALAEYAVRAAQDPKFWGLSWAQTPDTRCRVVVVKNLEVAQHERDWLSNRHGLILSFEDSAERTYEAAIFPETMWKAGWTKEHTIDALYRKAGYSRRRPPMQAMMAALPGGEGGVDGQGDEYDHDPVVARTAVFLRFETVTFRMEFRKYQKVKKKRAAAKRAAIPGQGQSTWA